MFITGGTGFLGRSLLDYVCDVHDANGDAGQVTILSREPQAFLDRFPRYRNCPRLTFVQGSLADLAAIDGEFTDFLHAADDTHRRDSGLAWFRQIVTGAEQALECAIRTRVRRFLFVSSGAVYGPATAGLHWAESAATAPSSTDVATSYAQGKRAAEHLCVLYAAEHGLECVIARCFALLSPHIPLDGPYAAGNFVRDALEENGDAIHVSGDGTAVRTYLSGSDMAHWMFTLLRWGLAGEAYNVGSADAVTMRELAELVRDTLAPEKSVVVAGGTASTDPNIYVPDIEKARALGLEVTTRLPELVAQVGAAIRAQNLNTGVGRKSAGI